MKYYSSVSLFFKLSIRAITESLELSAMEWASISLSWASSAPHCATKEAYLGKISATRMPQRFLQPSWTKESHCKFFPRTSQLSALHGVAFQSLSKAPQLQDFHTLRTSKKSLIFPTKRQSLEDTEDHHTCFQVYNDQITNIIKYELQLNS